MSSIKAPVVITIVLLLCITLPGLSFKEGELKKNIPVSNTGFAVVELFTSEGCSSCPPADQALENISKVFKGNVYLLGFHVDYWNQLGWKDTFSSAVYSNRQRWYTQAFEKDGVYTPQAIVNGIEQFVGSDMDKLNRTITKQLAASSNAAPVIAVATADKVIAVTYEVKENPALMLNIALLQLHAVTNVKNGENEGRTLSHINVVRDFKTVNAVAGKGKVNLSLPEAATVSDYIIIAYLQERNTFKITGAVELSLK